MDPSLGASGPRDAHSGSASDRLRGDSEDRRLHVDATVLGVERGRLARSVRDHGGHREVHMASLGVLASVAPARTSGSALLGVRFQTVSRTPEVKRFSARMKTIEETLTLYFRHGEARSRDAPRRRGTPPRAVTTDRHATLRPPSTRSSPATVTCRSASSAANTRRASA